MMQKYPRASLVWREWGRSNPHLSASLASRDCPLCKAGQHIDALVNSFGYSAL